MFNNTCKVVSHVSDQNVGVLLPHSTNILTFDEIDKKIIKTKKHIEYLSNQLPLNNRGGKAFRAKKVSITQQISLSTSRLKLFEQAKLKLLEQAKLKLLEQAKAVVLNPLIITKPSAPVQKRRQPITFKKDEDVVLFARDYFKKIDRDGIQSYLICGGHSELFERIIENIKIKKTLQRY